ncbi:MAG: hypothetical protein ACJ8GN_15225 [Longimicrobiaceae bacterium]
MRVRTGTTAQPCHISAALLKAGSLSAALRRVARRIAAPGTGAALAAPVVAGFASELLSGTTAFPAACGGLSTRYLVVIDVPEPALMRLPALLELRRPDYRLHVTRNVGAVRRLLVSSLREDPRLGVVDAYLLGDALIVLTGDFEIRSFPIARVPELAALSADERGAFEIDADGAYLHWPARDLHVGVSQLLQATDPAFATGIEIERNSNDLGGRALRSIREERGVRQIDVPGLSERQVRRIEDGLSRLRPASASSFAAALGMSVGDLLAEIGRRAVQLRGRT